MKKVNLLFSLAFILALALPAAAQQKINFSKLVVVGDSLAAGVENGSLWDQQQVHGFASVIAREANAQLTLPLVPYPGAPNTLELISPQFPPVIQSVPGALIFPRLNPFETVTNLAVPLQTVEDALNRKPNANILTTTDTTQLATDIVLGFPCPILFPWCNNGSQVQQAVALRPTAVIVELGSNDILGALTSGGITGLPAQITSFVSSYQTMLNDLSSTHPKLIVANIPNVIETPYFIPLSKLAAEEGANVSVLAAILNIAPTDYVTLDSVPVIEKIVSGGGGSLSDCALAATPCYVTQPEALAVEAITIQLNAAIASEAASHGAVLVDLYSLVDKIYTQGYSLGSVTLTSDFLGGLSPSTDCILRTPDMRLWPTSSSRTSTHLLELKFLRQM
jgi:lysophospholipase L1-like esterase